MNFGGGWGTYMVHHIFFVYYSKKLKKYKSITYTEVKFYIILIYNFFSGTNNKKIKKRGPKLRER